MARHKQRPDREHETALIVAARAGDAGAVRELIDTHKDRLFSFIWRMARNYHDTEEICQEAFLKAIRSLDSFSSTYRFSTWLFTIAYRVCLNRLRRKRAIVGEIDLAHLPETKEPAGAGATSEEAGHLRDCVWSAVDRLTPPQRASVLLFYRHDLNCQEIARILELPVATVKSHLHRARARLRQDLAFVSSEDLRDFRNLAGSAG